MKTFKKFMNKIPKPIRKIARIGLDVSMAPEIFNQGKKGSFTDKAMTEIDRFVGSKTRIRSNPDHIQDTDLGKRAGEYLMKKIKSLRKNKKNDVKEDTSSKSAYGDGHDYSKGLALTGRLDYGKGKKSEYDVGLSYKGSVLARKTRKFDKPERTSPKDAVDAALNKLNKKTPDKGGERTT